MYSCPNCGADLEATVIATVDEEIQVCAVCGFELLRFWIDRDAVPVRMLPPLLRDEYDAS
jgi:hypothetical protein